MDSVEYKQALSIYDSAKIYELEEECVYYTKDKNSRLIINVALGWGLDLKTITEETKRSMMESDDTLLLKLHDPMSALRLVSFAAATALFAYCARPEVDRKELDLNLKIIQCATFLIRVESLAKRYQQLNPVLPPEFIKSLLEDVENAEV